MRGDIQVVKVQAHLPAAVFEAGLAACLEHEDAAHGVGGSAEEVGAVLPTAVPATDELQPSLMHQRGGLQGLPVLLARHACGSQPAQLLIDQRQELLGGEALAPAGGLEH